MRSLKVFCGHFPPVPIDAMRSIPRAPCRMAASASSWTSLDDITPVAHFFLSASFSGRSFSGQSSEAAGSASEMRRRFCLQPLLPLSQQSNAVAKNKNASQKCSFILAWVGATYTAGLGHCRQWNPNSGSIVSIGPVLGQRCVTYMKKVFEK